MEDKYIAVIFGIIAAAIVAVAAIATVGYDYQQVKAFELGYTQTTLPGHVGVEWVKR